ncbi:MAG TPA: lysylphosphatidylglycerol synthase transmembrane domain-containing protein [Candidatus Limnocylindria bacterium]|nr:lysylphosphatidylglycerol synthase transmembrane domain-containing protein [Candidatus Limnocylindria bacterium]
MTEKLKSRRWKLALNIVTIVALVGLTYAVRKQLAETFANLNRVNLWILLLMIPTQALNYFAQANLYQSLFRAVGERFRFRSILRLALELNFVNTVFPSGGVSGFSYITLRLKSEDVSTAKATLVQMMRFVLIFISVQILLFSGLVALAIGGQANDFAILLAGILGTLITVFTLLIGFVIGSKARINVFFTFIARLINGLIHIFRPNHPETISIARAKRAFTELNETFVQLKSDLPTLKRPLGFALLSVTAEVLTIYIVYVAFGQWVNIGAVIMAYAVANFAGLVSILPGGIGVYEALMTGVLTAGGIPAAISLPVTVMYRVLNMAIQLPVGYFFYHQTLHAEPAIAARLEHTLENDD